MVRWWHVPQRSLKDMVQQNDILLRTLGDMQRFFLFDATKNEGGPEYCRYSRELSLCPMQKVGKKFAGVQKCPYLCSEKKNKSTNN